MALSTGYYVSSKCTAKNCLFVLEDTSQTGKVLLYQDTLPVEFAFDYPRNTFNA